jgi:hypothetical protein
MGKISIGILTQNKFLLNASRRMSHIMELILMDRWMADITYMSSTTK